MPASIHDEIELPLRKLDGEATLTVRLKITREWRVRFWIAKALMTLAARVLGAEPDIKEIQ